MNHKKTLTTIFILTFLTMLTIPLISAPSWGGGMWGYRSPLDYLENEWVTFTILFLIFFAVIYYSINKTTKNPAVSVIVALGISLFISLALTRRGLLWGYGQGIDTWVLLGAAIIGIGFLIRFAAESFGRAGAIATIIIVWIILNAIDPYQILPDTLLYSDNFMMFYGVLKSIFGAIVLIIITILFIKGDEDRSPGQQILKSLFGRRSRW